MEPSSHKLSKLTTTTTYSFCTASVTKLLFQFDSRLLVWTRNDCAICLVTTVWFSAHCQGCFDIVSKYQCFCFLLWAVWRVGLLLWRSTYCNN